MSQALSPRNFSKEPNQPPVETSTDPIRIICNLSDAPPFTAGPNVPPLPVLVNIGVERFHQCRLLGIWDMERAVSENADSLMRSSRYLFPYDPSSTSVDRWQDLTFEFGARSFLHVEFGAVVGYATSAAEAERLVVDFAKKYRRPELPDVGSFELIKISRDYIGTLSVPLDQGTILPNETLNLHYGDGFSDWHQNFARELGERSNGVSIFEGAPGTGKTSYLRHLMGVLRESHRFYFVPPSTIGVLSNPEFIDFWSKQRDNNPLHKFVVILEDSDEAIMRRGRDNCEHVSAILNLSDGMLAAFLRLQIICTVNCAGADIDQALLRPGRLLCHRIFGRLDQSQALRLAQSIGRTLPSAHDYSLAEVFAGHESESINRPSIGFGN